MFFLCSVKMKQNKHVMNVHWWVEHRSEVGMCIGAVLAQLQALDPCGQTNIFEEAIKYLAALRSFDRQNHCYVEQHIP